MDKSLKIDSCATSGCGWACCKFQKDSYIIMFPDELEQAKNTDHLVVEDHDYKGGGKKVHCHAKDTKNCDNGYKPIHCRLYPVWIRSSETLVRSQKCPLSNAAVAIHSKIAIKTLRQFQKDNPLVDVQKFVDNVEIDRYENFNADEHSI